MKQKEVKTMTDFEQLKKTFEGFSSKLKVHIDGSQGVASADAEFEYGKDFTSLSELNDEIAMFVDEHCLDYVENYIEDFIEDEDEDPEFVDESIQAEAFAECINDAGDIIITVPETGVEYLWDELNFILKTR